MSTQGWNDYNLLENKRSNFAKREDIKGILRICYFTQMSILEPVEKIN